MLTVNLGRAGVVNKNTNTHISPTPIHAFHSSHHTAPTPPWRSRACPPRSGAPCGRTPRRQLSSRGPVGRPGPRGPTSSAAGAMPCSSSSSSGSNDSSRKRGSGRACPLRPRVRGVTARAPPRLPWCWACMGIPPAQAPAPCPSWGLASRGMRPCPHSRRGNQRAPRRRQNRPRRTPPGCLCPCRPRPSPRWRPSLQPATGLPHHPPSFPRPGRRPATAGAARGLARGCRPMAGPRRHCSGARRCPPHAPPPPPRCPRRPSGPWSGQTAPADGGGATACPPPQPRPPPLSPAAAPLWVGGRQSRSLSRGQQGPERALALAAAGAGAGVARRR